MIPGDARSDTRRRKRPWASIRTRLTLIYGALFLLSGIGLLAINYVLVDHATSNETVSLVLPDGGGASVSVDLATGEEASPDPGESAPGSASLGNGDAPAASSMPDAATMRELASAQHNAHMQTLLVQSGIALALMTALSVALGWFMAHRTLRPLRVITTTTRQITAQRLDERLALDGPDDELKELADTIDDLFTRLDHVFQAQRRFVANASHELRTPLARQRTIAQVALDDPEATAGALRAAHERVLASGAQQEQLIDTLLTLARGQNADVGEDQFDLAVIAVNAVKATADEARRADVTVATDLRNAAMRGDAKLIERLIVNLLENAIRYNHPAGSVQVTTTELNAGQGLALTVENTGPTIRTDEVDDLFEPFRRLDSGRTAHGDGHGLGLSIVRAVADAHGATIDARARPNGGLRIEVRFSTGAPAAKSGANLPRAKS